MLIIIFLPVIIMKKPIDRICAIIRICRLIIDTQTNTLDWFSHERRNRRTDQRYQVHYLPRFDKNYITKKVKF